MLGVIATLRIKPGANAEFEKAMGELQKAVRANEPGNKLYVLHKTDDPTVYVMLERYENQAALEAHRASTHFKTLGAALGPHMAGRPEVKIMEEVS
ncbi:MAG: putative quinol monooxygenase [Reyranellaceae bacterium]